MSRSVRAGYHTAYCRLVHKLKGACECMVVVYFSVKGSSEYKRESFLNVHHYLKWRECMGRKLTDLHRVGKYTAIRV